MSSKHDKSILLESWQRSCVRLYPSQARERMSAGIDTMILSFVKINCSLYVDGIDIKMAPFSIAGLTFSITQRMKMRKLKSRGAGNIEYPIR